MAQGGLGEGAESVRATRIAGSDADFSTPDPTLRKSIHHPDLAPLHDAAQPIRPIPSQGLAARGPCGASNKAPVQALITHGAGSVIRAGVPRRGGPQLPTSFLMALQKSALLRWPRPALSSTCSPPIPPTPPGPGWGKDRGVKGCEGDSVRTERSISLTVFARPLSQAVSLRADRAVVSGGRSKQSWAGWG